MDQDVFKLVKARHVALDLGRTPAGGLAGFALGEAVVLGIDVVCLAGGFDHVPQQIEEAARLRRHFVQAAAQDDTGQAVGGGNVLQCDFNVPGAVDGAAGTLVLVKQGDGANEGEVFLLVAAQTGILVGEC